MSFRLWPAANKPRISGQACLTWPSLVLGFSRVRVRRRSRLSCSFGVVSKRPLFCRPRERGTVTGHFTKFRESLPQISADRHPSHRFENVSENYPVLSAYFNSEDHQLKN